MLEIAFNSDTDIQGTLFMDERRMSNLTSLVPSAISITQRSRPERDGVERFIEAQYARHYGSRISRHYPTLMSVYDREGAIAAAVGLRFAAEEPLFLEQYLVRPVEAAVAAATGLPLDRATIVEIGNLASAGKGASVFLFVTLAAYLRELELGYAVVTATRALRRSFALLGVEFRELAAADAAALPDRGASWGRYYGCDPKVVTGAIPPAFARLEPYLPAKHNGDLPRLFPRLHPATASQVQ